MEHFSISCSTCAAKLRVTRASAVGQSLACPKCGNMVRVTAPAGWTAPEPESGESESRESRTRNPAGETDSRELADLSSGHFDDIEDVLAATQDTANPLARPRASRPPRSATGGLPTTPPASGSKKINPATAANPKRGNAQSAKDSSSENPGRQVQPPSRPSTRSSSAKLSSTSSTSSPANEAGATRLPDTETVTPMLPDGKWTSPESRARKKMLLISGICLGGLILIGTGFGAWFVNRPAPTAPVVAANPEADTDPDNPDRAHEDELAEEIKDASTVGSTGNDDETTDAETTDTETTDADEDTDAVDADSSEQENASDAGADTDGADSIDVDKTNAGESNMETTVADPAIPVATIPVATIPVATIPEPTNDDSANEPAGNDPAMDGQSEQTAGEQDPLDRNPLNPNPLNRNLGGGGVLNGGLNPSGLEGPGELSQLLKEVAGSSILEIQNLANSIRDLEIAGVPKYYIPKPELNSVDVLKQLGQNCPGIQYKDKPVIFFLREMSATLGVTCQIDADSWQAAGIPFDIKTDVFEQNKDYSATIDSVLKQVKLAKTITPEGMIVIHAIDAGKTTAADYSLPAVNNPAPERRQIQVDAIKQLVNPQSWLRETHAATLQLDGDKITVNQDSLGHWQMKVLLNKVNAAQNLRDGINPDQCRNTLQSKWTSASALIEHPMTMQPAYPTPIETLLTRIYMRSGVLILVDWESLSRAGWTPATIVPGEFNEATPLAAVRELAVSMELTVRALDAKTLQMTTFDSASTKNELEIFYCGDIIKGALTEQMLSELFNQTIGPRLNATPGVRVDYDPELKCILSLAPQPLQQQIDAILKRLGGL